LTLISFDDSAIKPSKEGKEKAGGKLPPSGVGWLGKLGLVYLNGSNFFETIMLNFVLINNDNIECDEQPMWEMDDPVKEERREIPYPTNLAQLYTLQSRHILLNRCGDKIMGYIAIRGDSFTDKNAFIEPMTTWKINKTDYLPKKHCASEQMWREFSNIYNNSNGNHVPGVIKWFKFISTKVKLPMMRTTVLSVDYDKNNCSIQNVFGDSLEMNAQILSEVGRGYREEIKFEISRCEELAKKIGNLAWNIYLASGGNKNSKPKDIGSILDAKSQLYYRLDIPFRSWLSSLDPENDDKLEKFEQWQNTAKRITLDLGRELVAAVDDTAMVGHMIDETIYSAPKAYNIFLRDVSKIYQKI